MGLWHSHNDNHFLLKVYRISEMEFSDFYKYHLDYCLKNNLANEEDFYRYVWEIVNARIKHFERQDPFSRNKKSNKRNLDKTRKFKSYLSSIDKWNARPSHIVINEKEETIYSLKSEIEELKTELSKLKEYDVNGKIRISEGHLPTFIDLIQQMRELKVSDSRKLLRSDHKLPFAKMISKYFSHGEKDIPIETARNYFVEKKGDVPIKGTAIKEEHQLFKIIPSNPSKK